MARQIITVIAVFGVVAWISWLILVSMRQYIVARAQNVAQDELLARVDSTFPVKQLTQPEAKRRLSLIFATMKTILTMLLIFAALPFAFAQNEDAATLKQLNSDWIGSYVTRDTMTLGRIFADDMVLVSPNGSIFHKKEMLRMLKSPDQEYLSAKVDAVSVRLLGSVGLVSAQATAVAKVNGKVTTIRTSYLDVYEKRRGRWYAVASQVALLSMK